MLAYYFFISPITVLVCALIIPLLSPLFTDFAEQSNNTHCEQEHD